MDEEQDSRPTAAESGRLVAAQHRRNSLCNSCFPVFSMLHKELISNVV